jgi:hypothetical protein
MPRRAPTVTQADIARLIKGTLAAGISREAIRAVETDPHRGTVRIEVGPAAEASSGIANAPEQPDIEEVPNHFDQFLPE